MDRIPWRWRICCTGWPTPIHSRWSVWCTCIIGCGVTMPTVTPRPCANLAGRLGLPYHEDAVDVPALADERRCSVEAAGRAARLTFFQRVAGEVRADRVAVGHTVDDQAETFLLRLLRGAGTRGLSGIYPRHGVVIRPVLDVTRTELREFLGAHGIPFRDDASNADLSIPRNRVRHKLLPYLREHFSGGITDVLAREADCGPGRRRLAGCRGEPGGGPRRPSTRGAPSRSMRPHWAGCQRRWRVGSPARRSVQGAGGRFVGFAHVEALRQLGGTAGAGRVSLPGQVAARVGDRVRLTSLDEARPPLARAAFAYALSVPGEVTVAEAEVVVTAEHAGVPDRSALSNRGGTVAIDAAHLGRAVDRARTTAGRPPSAARRAGRALGAGSIRRSQSSPIASRSRADRDRFQGANRVDRGADHCPRSSNHGRDAVRDTLDGQAVRRSRMNPTLRSLLFWMVLVVVGVLIWSFSADFQTSDTAQNFSEFIEQVEAGQVESVTMTGNEIVGTLKNAERFRTYAPPQYEGLANTLLERGVQITAEEAASSPWATLLYSWAPVLLIIGVLDLLHAADAELRQQGAVVRQEPCEAVLEHAEEGDVQGRRRAWMRRRRSCRRSSSF